MHQRKRFGPVAGAAVQVGVVLLVALTCTFNTSTDPHLSAPWLL